MRTSEGFSQFPSVDGVIGNSARKVRRQAGAIVVRSEGQQANRPLDLSWRYDDYYGFNRLSVFAH